jgi:hypothetical protein
VVVVVIAEVAAVDEEEDGVVVTARPALEMEASKTSLRWLARRLRLLATSCVDRFVVA